MRCLMPISVQILRMVLVVTRPSAKSVELF